MEFERALYAELYAINGVSVDEIITRFGSLLSYENEYYLNIPAAMLDEHYWFEYFPMKA